MTGVASDPPRVCGFRDFMQIKCIENGKMSGWGSEEKKETILGGAEDLVKFPFLPPKTSRSLSQAVIHQQQVAASGL
jgi:hypothetical protein